MISYKNVLIVISTIMICVMLRSVTVPQRGLWQVIIYNSTIGNWNPIGESYVYSSEVDDAIGYQREEYYEKLEGVIEGN